MHLSKMDAVEFLREIQSESIDLVITDPAYESLEKYRKIGSTTRLKHSNASSNEWFEIFPNSRYQELFTEVYRVLKMNTHFYMMCDEETLFVIRPIAELCGFKFWKSIIWDKQVMGMGYHYRNRTERIALFEKEEEEQTQRIAFFEKGKRKLNSNSVPDILSVKRVYRGYPTEKPVELFDILINQSSEPGEIVLDPFFGSGAVLISAQNNGRLAIGNDKSDAAHNHIENRLNNGE